jgi:hypothetical protein
MRAAAPMPAKAARRLVLFAGVLLASAAIPSTALATGGNYTIVGGNAFERSQVRQALAASSFNWSVVPGAITITITPEPVSQAVPGGIVLDPELLDMGEFSWGVVQHEYAHQVDFALLSDDARSQIEEALGGTAWCYGDGVLPHSQYGCERFASTLAWAFWQSPMNSMSPVAIGGESSGMAPAAFRALITSILGASSVQAQAPTTVPNGSPRYAPVLPPARSHDRVACERSHSRSAFAGSAT